jgi:hypothetical protein
MKYYLLLFLLFHLFSIDKGYPVSAENSMQLQLKPAKLITYQIYMYNETSLFDVYNKNICYYTLTNVDDVLDDLLELTIRSEHDGRPCCSLAWYFPLNNYSKYVLKKNGEIIKTLKNEFIIDIYRVIPLKFNEPNLEFFPVVAFPEEIVILNKEYIKRVDDVIDGKQVTSYIHSIYKRSAADSNRIEFIYIRKIDNQDEVKIQGLFDYEKGYILEYEVFIKMSEKKDLKSFIKFVCMKYEP